MDRSKKDLMYYIRGIRAVRDEYLFRLWTILTGKRRYFAARPKNRFKRRFILCYPEKPGSLHSFYPLCRALGLKITTDPHKDATIIMHFEDATFRNNHPVLNELAKTKRIINGRCSDISKEKVDEVFSRVFGYSLSIDPRVHTGPCVEKSNINGANDGRIVDCPRSPQEGYIYQKLVDTQDGDMAVDMRISIFGSEIPLVYLRHKHITDRFRNTQKAVRVPASDVLSEGEQRKIILFCKELGFDYGELDAVREKSDGKLYIVDANTTPWCPHPGHQISFDEYEYFLKTSSDCFASEFMLD